MSTSGAGCCPAPASCARAGAGAAAAAAATAALTGGLLRYPAGSAGLWILGIETAALLSIGLTLGALYLAGRPDVD